MEKLAINGGIPVRETKIYYGKQWIDENVLWSSIPELDMRLQSVTEQLHFIVRVWQQELVQEMK